MSGLLGAYYDGNKTSPLRRGLWPAPKLPSKTGTLAGIIWHQGESDSSPEKSAVYRQKLELLIQKLREDLQTPAVPFVAGQLPAFQINKPGADGRLQVNNAAIRINEAVAALTKQVPNYAYVTAEGTSDIGDHTHFDAASARLLGQRYAAAMQQLQRRPKK